MPVAGAKFRDPYDYPSYQVGGAHGGTDFATAEGVSRGDVVRSVLGGKIISVANTSSTADYGTYIVIESNYNGKTYRFWYCHMQNPSNFKTSDVGKTISQGTSLGLVGSTGYVIPSGTAGTHLHFEVRKSPFNKADRISPKSLY